MGWHSRSELGEFRRPVLVGYVTRLETLLIILLFSVLFWVCSLWLRLPFFSVRSIMLWIISVTLFMNYGFVIIDYTARGLDKLPALSGELVFPTHDTRLFRVIGLSLVFFGIHESLEDQSARQAFVMASFFVYPIFFAVMIVSRNAGQLLNPVTLFG
ncbi:MAG: hypothetical protein KDI36_15155, partial [Pseudomonadales bacterium]|nr:hypothetical protein [Pseudomonadales bacterium]